MVWPFDSKNFRNVGRISAAFIGGRRLAGSGGAAAPAKPHGRQVRRRRSGAPRAAAATCRPSVVVGGAPLAGAVRDRRRPFGSAPAPRRRAPAPAQQPLGLAAVLRIVGDAERDRDRCSPPPTMNGAASAAPSLAATRSASAGDSIEPSRTANLVADRGDDVAGAHAGAQAHRDLAPQLSASVLGAAAPAQPSMRKASTAIGDGSRSRNASSWLRCSTSCWRCGRPVPGSVV